MDHPWVNSLALASHPEGGWFRETWRAPSSVIDVGRGVERSAGTSIVYALLEGEFSSFHRIASDEVWLHHAGAPMRVHVLDSLGYHSLVIGSVDAGYTPQAVVRAGAWFAAEPVDGASLVGCVVAPGFDFADFEIAERAALIEVFPQHRALIERFTR